MMDELIYFLKEGRSGEMELHFGYDEQTMVSAADYLEFTLNKIDSELAAVRKRKSELEKIKMAEREME